MDGFACAPTDGSLSSVVIVVCCAEVLARDTTAHGQTGAVLAGVAQIVAALTTIIVVVVTRQ